MFKSGYIKQWLWPLVVNFLLLLGLYFICRIAFLLENWKRFSDLDMGTLWAAFRGGLRFDFSAICYVNSLFVLLFIGQLLFYRRWYQQLQKWLFIVTNAICIGANLTDAVYFEFIKRRATMSVFREFANDDLTNVITIEMAHHWYLVLLFVLMAGVLFMCYRPSTLPTANTWWLRGFRTVLSLTVAVAVVVCGIRGGYDPELRPLNNKDAKEYVANPMQSALVLNTPFSILRTIGKHAFPNPTYYVPQELDSIYSPVHQSCAGVNKKNPNIVIIILESFSSEYSALLNSEARNNGHMPFLDSLMLRSRYYEYSFANGKSSIDGQASVLASIPMMVESFFTSHAALNDITGIGTELKKRGYRTAFFHGADNGSLSIDGFTHSVGFDQYHGRTEYNNDADWDHHWGIWDEPFLQYFGREIGKMPQPFCVGVFTLTSHHPYQIPAKYKEVFKEGELPVYKSVEYADMALRKFFDYAKRQSWYGNTLFVLTGDHINQTKYPYYNTSIGTYQVPIVFYHPTDTLFQGGMHQGIAQHIDIMPTILSYVGCRDPYIAFGKDLLTISETDTWAIQYNNDIYQFVQGDYFVQFDGENVVGLYCYKTDRMLAENLVSDTKFQSVRDSLARKLKAIVQAYMYRMNNNLLTVSCLQK